jgi:hypothetical protein
VSSGSVEYTVEQSFAPSAAVVAEAQLKPQMAATYTEATVRHHRAVRQGYSAIVE